MLEFIDKTSVKNGTPINRANLMAIQGFMAKTTVFKDDGSIEETNNKGEKLITEFEDDKVIETFIGEYTMVKTVIFEGDTITEAVQEVAQ